MELGTIEDIRETTRTNEVLTGMKQQQRRATLTTATAATTGGSGPGDGGGSSDGRGSVRKASAIMQEGLTGNMCK